MGKPNKVQPDRSSILHALTCQEQYPLQHGLGWKWWRKNIPMFQWSPCYDIERAIEELEINKCKPSICHRETVILASHYVLCDCTEPLAFHTVLSDTKNVSISPPPPSKAFIVLLLQRYYSICLPAFLHAFGFLFLLPVFQSCIKQLSKSEALLCNLWNETLQKH